MMRVFAVVLLVVASIALLSGLGGTVALVVSHDLRSQADNLWIAAILQVTVSLVIIIGAAAVLGSRLRVLRVMRVILPVLVVLVLLDGFMNFDGEIHAAFLVSVFAFQVVPAIVLWILAHLSLLGRCSSDGLKGA